MQNRKALPKSEEAHPKTMRMMRLEQLHVVLTEVPCVLMPLAKLLIYTHVSAQSAVILDMRCVFFVPLQRNILNVRRR